MIQTKDKFSVSLLQVLLAVKLRLNPCLAFVLAKVLNHKRLHAFDA